VVNEKYTGSGKGIREHILRMSNLTSKLKPLHADLEIKPVGDSPRGPLKQLGNPHLKPATKPKPNT
jgi:hypothetical protein